MLIKSARYCPTTLENEDVNTLLWRALMEQLRNLMEKRQLSIVDGMIDWVRVIDRDNVIVYANKKMREDLGEEIIGKKCFEIFGRTNKCEDCISYETLIKGSIHKKETNYNGRIYTVISSPMMDENKQITGSVEVFRDITNEKLMELSISEKNKKMSDDINFARSMQERMLPPKGMYNGVSIDYLYESSELLSGDFFDVFKIDTENTGIYMCDVVGHGITASLLTIFVRQALRTAARTGLDAGRIISELHKTFLGLNLDSDKYFSVFFGMYNQKTKDFKYINAGHNSVPVLATGNEIIMLEAKGYPVCNIFDSVEYDVNSIQLNVKDRLFFYTDGITESKNDSGEDYGVDRLIEVIKSEDNILEKLKTSLKSYSKNQKDDYAMLVVEII